MNPEDTVPCRVNYAQRTFTDKIWSVINLASYITFLITGFIAVSRSHPRHVITDDGTFSLGEYYMDSAQKCCANNGGIGFVCDLYANSVNQGNRRLTAGESKFLFDEDIFDAFVGAPEIIVGLLSIVLGVALLWTILLRFFAKPIVIIVEVLKVAGMITAGVMQEVTETRILCFVGAALMVGYIVWQWKNILFAADIISHSTIALKENPSILVGGLLIKVLYAGNAALFVLFFSTSFNVAEVADLSEYYKNDENFSASPRCEFIYPRYMTAFSWIWSISYLWNLLFFDQMLLSVVATLVGSWHFHPEDRPSVWTALKNILPSSGTISITSLIATIAEYLHQRLNMSAMYWVSPMRCFTWAFDCLMCIVAAALHQCTMMFTSYALVLHVFTGEDFGKSARNAFNILSRHFEKGFVTDVTSKGLFAFASYAFSFCVALITWVWIDARFEADSLLESTNGYLWILWYIVILFSTYYPVLGIYFLIVANRFLRQWEEAKHENGLTDEVVNDDGFNFFTEQANHIWIPPLAASFVGCIAMLFFAFMSKVFISIITTLFLCFAIDKDNNVDLTNTELEAIVTQMPAYKGDKSVGRTDEETPIARAEIVEQSPSV